MRARGFTLIELMIVVAIIGIMAALALPKLDFQRRNDHNEVVREIYNGFNRARSEAIRTSRSVTVEIESTRMTAFVDANTNAIYDAGESLVYQFPKDPKVWPFAMTLDTTQLNALNVKPVAIFDYQGFAIDVNGQPCAASVTVTDPQLANRAKRIEFTIAGAVRIY